MNSEESRKAIFAKLKEATSSFQDRTQLPEYDVTLTHSQPKLVGQSLWEIFTKNFKAVSGKPMVAVDELIDLLKQEGRTIGYCDPNLYETVGKFLSQSGLTVETHYDRCQYEKYQFGITQASGLIAESGTVIIDDYKTSCRLAALSPWIHVAVVRSSEIHRTLSDALAALGDCPNVIWCTGPSKTADVEGILIEGVHGPGEQVALLIDC